MRVSGEESWVDNAWSVSEKPQKKKMTMQRKAKGEKNGTAERKREKQT